MWGNQGSCLSLVTEALWSRPLFQIARELSMRTSCSVIINAAFRSYPVKTISYLSKFEACIFWWNRILKSLNLYLFEFLLIWLLVWKSTWMRIFTGRGNLRWKFVRLNDFLYKFFFLLFGLNSEPVWLKPHNNLTRWLSEWVNYPLKINTINYSWFDSH